MPERAAGGHLHRYRPRQDRRGGNPWATNLGNIGQCPTVDAVYQALLARKDMQ
jgi:hypothetical protein